MKRILYVVSSLVFISALVAAQIAARPVSGERGVVASPDAEAARVCLLEQPL